MLIGMCIVDLHRMYRNKKRGHYSEIDVLEFSDYVCKNLVKRNVRQNKQLASMSGTDLENTSILERISNKDGNERFKVSNKQARRGRNVGKSIHLNCFVCRKYLDPGGEVNYVQTTFRCYECKMPLCKKDRSNPTIGRNKSCVDEHVETDCKVVGCFGYDQQYAFFPKDEQVQLVSC